MEPEGRPDAEAQPSAAPCRPSARDGGTGHGTPKVVRFAGWPDARSITCTAVTVERTRGGAYRVATRSGSPKPSLITSTFGK
ncbi:MAG: hypothetical protein KatS3mg060_0886 [Dehalococcoidia bacterium]|nr:MAG: hypothetical protein KatS3mg060_0886 [Dehalococcoidia bacterium]